MKVQLDGKKYRQADNVLASSAASSFIKIVQQKLIERVYEVVTTSSISFHLIAENSREDWNFYRERATAFNFICRLKRFKYLIAWSEGASLQNNLIKESKVLEQSLRREPKKNTEEEYRTRTSAQIEDVNASREASE